MKYLWEELKYILTEINQSIRTMLLGLAAFSGEEKRYVKKRLLKTNQHRTFIFLFALILIEAGVILFAVIYNKERVLNANLKLHYAILAFAVVFFVLMCLQVVVRKNQPSAELHVLIWLLCVGTGLYFAVQEFLSNGTIIYFIYLCIALALIPLLEKGEAFALFGISFLVEMGVFIWKDAPYVMIRQVATASIIAFFASQVLISAHVFTQISYYKLEKSNRILEELSITDPLTGLYNRRGVEEHLLHVWPQFVRSEEQIMVAMVDVDFFKKYNDRFGHTQGDECLTQIAHCLQQQSRRATDVVARYGGEEFVILVTIMEKDSIIPYAKKILEEVENLKITAGDVQTSKYVTISMGIVTAIPSHQTTFQELLRDADAQLYHAKKNGRNCISYQNILYQNET